MKKIRTVAKIQTLMNTASLNINQVMREEVPQAKAEENAVGTEEASDQGGIPEIRLTPSQKTASRQGRKGKYAKESPSQSKGTPTRPILHRDAKMVSPEALAKTRNSTFISRLDPLTLPIRRGNSHAHSQSTRNLRDL
ncbi:hypothetical protein BGZ60DRAFT_530438 [Tricladium varicosporioides]|nr:hypothetical protein BGZ60DRAFT_530438 [Hymenoscyphus varicosporioides]